MFLVPTLLFSSLSLVVSLNNNAYSSVYCDTRNNTETQTFGYFNLEYYIDDSSDAEVFDNGVVNLKSEFTYEHGRYTDVPDSVDVTYTGYIYAGYTRKYNSETSYFESQINFGHSTTPINMIVSFQYANIYYYDTTDDIIDDYNIYGKDYAFSNDNSSVTNLEDMYLISRDDDDFYIYFNEPSHFSDDDDYVHFIGITFSFKYIVLPYFDNAITGDEYQLGYNDGYAVGDQDGMSNGYDIGYNNGYESGYDSGYGVGYNYGFTLGQTSDTNLRDIFFNIADVPIITMRGLFDFELFGMSMYAFVGSLIALFFMLLVVRKVF